MSYALLDSGHEEKFEQFGPFTLIRPCGQAIWLAQKQPWSADARFSRDSKNHWDFRKPLPKSWNISLHGITLKIAPTDFGHLGVFPEHALLWEWMRKHISKQMKVLNLFAYSGAASLAAAQEGAVVCHLDASKGMVDWAKENAKLNRLDHAPIRWIVDDALKFLKREERRKQFYDAILLDPPTFGRGSKGELFKIETDLIPLLQSCKAVLSDQARFLILSCHTPGITPIVLGHLMNQVFHKEPQTGEMLLSSPGALSIPSGSFARLIL